jgi:hypothetical protein
VLPTQPPNTTTYTDTGLVPGAQYTYTVQTAAESGLSAPATVTVTPR